MHDCTGDTASKCKTLSVSIERSTDFFPHPATDTKTDTKTINISDFFSHVATNTKTISISDSAANGSIGFVQCVRYDRRSRVA